jgi:hypothetical protein
MVLASGELVRTTETVVGERFRYSARNFKVTRPGPESLIARPAALIVFRLVGMMAVFTIPYDSFKVTPKSVAKPI